MDDKEIYEKNNEIDEQVEEAAEKSTENCEVDELNKDAAAEAVETQTEETEAFESEADSAVIDEESSEDIAEDAYRSEETAADLDKPKKKKSALYTSVIIAASIFVAVILFFGAYKLFFTSSIVGSWVYTEDKVTAEENGTPMPYLIFEKDGTAKYSIGTLSYYGTYTTETNNGASRIDVVVPYALSGTFDYSIDKHRLTIASDGDSIEFLQIKKVDSVVDVSEDFAVVDEVLGKWENQEQGVTYSVYKDGTMTFDLVSGNVGMHIDGTYTVKDGVITFKYLADTESTLPVEYEVNENGNLVIQGYEYTNTAQPVK